MPIGHAHGQCTGWKMHDATSSRGHRNRAEFERFGTIHYMSNEGRNRVMSGSRGQYALRQSLVYEEHL